MLGFRDWLRNIFSRDAIPADVRKLPSLSESDLRSSLRTLLPGERGWIPLRDAAHLFSMQEPEYAFGQMDVRGMPRVEAFARECSCDIQFMPTVGRLYFIRKG
jgi:hypothetical protein